MSKYKDYISRRATSLAIADVVSRFEFPKKESLPRFFPYPFNNFGHYFLFDYEFFTLNVYESIAELKKIIQIHQKNNRYTLLLGGFGVFIGSVVLTYLLFLFFYSFMYIILPPIILLFFIIVGLLVGIHFIKKEVKKRLVNKVLSYKIKTIEKILKDQQNSIKDESRTYKTKFLKDLIGDGDITKDDIPLLIIKSAGHPFPGYGILQLENTFVVQPKKKAIMKDSYEISENIKRMIRNDLLESELDNITFGKVISIAANSIDKDSPILNENKAPLLHCSNEVLKKISSSNSRLSFRSFFVVQVLFPEYMTSASFFIRFFKAGSSYAANISMTTLGPIAIKEKKILERLFYLKKAKKRKKNISNNLFNRQSYEFRSDPLDELDNIMNSDSISDDLVRELVQVSKVDEFLVFDPFETQQLNNNFYNHLKNKIINKNSHWPGQNGNIYNWRESNSLTFTDDFYGRSESIASIKSAYDLISKSILNSLEKQDFDISKYRDKEGNYSINADKIDQLIIGEKIKVKSSDSNSPNTKDHKSTNKDD